MRHLRSLHIFLVTLLSLLTLPYASNGAIVQYTLNYTWQLSNPDCFTRRILAVNGALVGPTLTARRGDTLSATVCNHLGDSGLSVHWHGLHQRQSPFNDGVSGITQCAIATDACQTYVVPLGDQIGSFFYHVHHSALSADGGHGAIVIYDAPQTQTSTGGALPTLSYMGRPIIAPGTLPSSSPPSSFLEQTWILTDWFHDDSVTLVAGLNMPNTAFKWVGEPNTILLNGKGSYCHDTKVGSNPWKTKAGDCPSNENDLYHTHPTCGYPILNASCSTPLLVHLINAASLSYLSLTIDEHSMELIGSDGSPVGSSSQGRLQSLKLNSGERFDVLLTRTDQTTCASYYRLSATSMYRPNQPTMYGVVQYIDSSTYTGLPNSVSFPMPPTSSERAFPQLLNITGPGVLASPLNGLRSVAIQANGSLVPLAPPAGLTRTPDVSLLLVGRQERVDGIMRWPINHVPNKVPRTPSYFMSLWNYTDVNSPVSVPLESRMIDLPLNSWVEAVFQNTFALNGVCEQHSWHLHGYYAYLVANGSGTFRPGIDNLTYAFDRVLLKDSWTIYPSLDPLTYPYAWNRFPFLGQPGDGCGWNVIRFQAMNPGVWSLHCHVVWHGHMGMGVVLHVKDAATPLPSPPPDVTICGDPAVIYRDPKNLMTLLPFLMNGSNAAGSSGVVTPPVVVTTQFRWYDFIGPAITVFVVIGASFRT